MGLRNAKLESEDNEQTVLEPRIPLIPRQYAKPLDMFDAATVLETHYYRRCRSAISRRGGQTTRAGFQETGK